VILPPDGDMSAYIASLDKLAALDFERIAPGHGELLSHGKEVVARLREHRMRREAKVLRCLKAPSTIDALVAQVYDDVPMERHGWAKLTLEAHLIKLARESKVREQRGVWRIAGE
jgi:glyoxylase-like metal-dependent hydrolase (beta-lactamase superfamily II)